MFYYAQLNDDMMCVGVSTLSGRVDKDNMIEIEKADINYLYRKYIDGIWSEEKFIDDVISEPTVEMEIEDLKGRQDITDNTILSLMDVILIGGM